MLPIPSNHSSVEPSLFDVGRDCSLRKRNEAVSLGRHRPRRKVDIGFKVWRNTRAITEREDKK